VVRSQNFFTALQGAFAEHEAILNKLTAATGTDSRCLVTSRLVRTAVDLNTCDALIIPGGESTTMALLARISGLLEPLRKFSRSKPVWGTCAGAILLSNGGVVGAKKGGQEVIGGFDVRVERNGWGSQVRKSIVIFQPIIITHLICTHSPRIAAHRRRRSSSRLSLTCLSRISKTLKDHSEVYSFVHLLGLFTNQCFEHV